MAMKIIAAWDFVTKEILTDSIIKKDLQYLRKKHIKALKSEPTWSFFGGVLTISNRRYQVVEVV